MGWIISSTSSNLEDSTSESITFTRRPQDNPSAPEDPDELLDAVIVDREWSNDIKTASSHSEHGVSPDKSGSNQLPGTNTDHESLTVHPDGFWGKHSSLIYLRWRLWPRAYSFFCLHFMDEKAEAHYVKENWFLRKVCSHHCVHRTPHHHPASLNLAFDYNTAHSIMVLI